MKIEQLISLVILLPLIGGFINGTIGSKLPKKIVGSLATTIMFIAFALALNVFAQLHHKVTVNWFTILRFDEFSLNASLLVDNLSIWMTLIVTGVGSLIHLFSMGYMSHDEGYYKFFTYLNLFIFAMLILILGSNYFMLFFGWEGVGICSYLLISFHYSDKVKGIANSAAGRKAFIMNRIGDLGLLIGLFLILQNFETLEYEGVHAKIADLADSPGTLVAITLCLFIGATGKSAQIPLFTWLPDAMAGPTPVSALIHAATMVTAGIFLVVRSNFLFELAGTTQDIMLYIGLATSLVAAFIAMRQNDIKKVLAYSTVSQLGFIFVALGMGAYTAAIFHVTTHAFFKALLFLGSGSVIHAMSDEQDIRQMGGLKKYIPTTHVTFLIGTLAIAGFPFLSGFFSKDEILAHAMNHNMGIYIALAFSALLTAVYMFRLYFVVFHGEFRGSEEVKHHLHESPKNMTIPLMVLAVLSVIGGFLATPFNFILPKHWFGHFLEHNVSGLSNVDPLHISAGQITTLMTVASILTLLALGITYNIYTKKGSVPVADDQLKGWAKLSANKLYFDEIYNALFVKPIEALSKFCYSIVEVLFLNNVVVGAARSIGMVGDLVRKVQTGRTEWYLLWMVAGIIGFVVYSLVKF